MFTIEFTIQEADDLIQAVQLAKQNVEVFYGTQPIVHRLSRLELRLRFHRLAEVLDQQGRLSAKLSPPSSMSVQ